MVQAYLSADVFGLTTSSDNDMGIGQDWSMISKQVHYISPMLYPSHYSNRVSMALRIRICSPMRLFIKQSVMQMGRTIN